MRTDSGAYAQGNGIGVVFRNRFKHIIDFGMGFEHLEVVCAWVIVSLSKAVLYVWSWPST